MSRPKAGGVDDTPEKPAAYCNGDETGLRNNQFVRMGTITSGVNRAAKHAIIAMWENGTTIDVQWSCTGDS